MTTWTWVLTDATDDVLARPTSPQFTSRFDAEAWLGENWRDLVARGVAAVQLVHNGRPVAGVVSLPGA